MNTLLHFALFTASISLAAQSSGSTANSQAGLPQSRPGEATVVVEARLSPFLNEREERLLEAREYLLQGLRAHRATADPGAVPGAALPRDPAASKLVPIDFGAFFHLFR